MTENKVKVCCLLLVLMICAAGMKFSVGEAFARYDNTISYSTVLGAPSPEMESNCLARMDEPAVTVLPGEVSMGVGSPLQITFWVKSAADAKRMVVFSARETELAGYINATLASGGEILGSGDYIELKAGEKTEITLTVTPTSAARGYAHDEMEINIALTLGDLCGTFRVIVPKVTESEAGAGSSGLDETDESENSDGTVLPESVGESMDASKADSAYSISQNSTAADEGSENEEETAEDETEENTGNSASSQSAYSEAAIGDTLEIKTVQSFDIRQKLPIILTVSGETTHVSFGVENSGELAAFPDFTGYSLDGGESYYVSYGGYVPVFEVGEISDCLLIDFSNAGIGEAEYVCPAVKGFSGSEAEGFRKAEVSVESWSFFETTVFSESVQIQMQTGEGSEASANADEMISAENRIITSGESIAIIFPVEWASSGYSFEYTVDFLALSYDESKTPIYSEVMPKNAANSGLSAIYTADYSGGTHNLVISALEENPPAGTYRVNLEWKYEEISFYESEITFFINYSSRTDYHSGS